MFRAFAHKLPGNFALCLRGYNVLWHVAAIAVTYALVTSGFDWWFFEATRSSLFDWFVLSAGIAGFFVPVLASAGLYLAGELRKSMRLMTAGATVAQASIIAITISSIYKAFTGRIQPEFLTHLSTVDISREFHFGFLQHGIFWGWPSSHAAVAVAGAVALLYVYRDTKLVIYPAILYALYISAGAAIGFHWFSDVVAGALIGAMIGMVVGRAFQTKLRM